VGLLHAAFANIHQKQGKNKPDGIGSKLVPGASREVNATPKEEFEHPITISDVQLPFSAGDLHF